MSKEASYLPAMSGPLRDSGIHGEPGIGTPLSNAAREFVLKAAVRLITGSDRNVSFNVLSLLKLGNDEVRHSCALAWFLDEEAEHGLGSAAAAKFLEAAGIEISAQDLTSYRVRTEYHLFSSRMDVVLYRSARFVIVIENKIDSLEGDNQTDREHEDLQHIGVGLNVPPQNRFAVFVTPSGSRPTGKIAKLWYPVSWRSLATKFQELYPTLKSDKARYFLEDWLDVLVTFGGNYDC